MITRTRIEAHRKATELAVIQTLKLRGDISVLRSLTECRRIFGREWMNEAVSNGLLVGVQVGKRTMYSVEKIIALQELQLQEAEGQLDKQ